MNHVLPSATVTNHASRLPAILLPDPNDRHVVAAAIEGGASTIVTWNTRDFPAGELRKHGLRKLTPDAFLVELHETSRRPDRRHDCKCAPESADLQNVRGRLSRGAGTAKTQKVRRENCPASLRSLERFAVSRRCRSCAPTGDGNSVRTSARRSGASPVIRPRRSRQQKSSRPVMQGNRPVTTSNPTCYAKSLPLFRTITGEPAFSSITICKSKVICRTARPFERVFPLINAQIREKCPVMAIFDGETASRPTMPTTRLWRLFPAAHRL